MSHRHAGRRYRFHLKRGWQTVQPWIWDWKIARQYFIILGIFTVAEIIVVVWSYL